MPVDLREALRVAADRPRGDLDLPAVQARAGRLQRNRLLVRGVAAAAAFVLVAGAAVAVVRNGDGSGSSIASGGSSAGDKKIALTGLLAVQDFPRGWVAVPVQRIATTGQARKPITGVPGCPALNTLIATERTATAARSGLFSDGTLAIENVVEVYPTEALAASELVGLRRAASTRCYHEFAKRAFSRSLTHNAQFPNLRGIRAAVGPTSVGTSLGDDQSALTVTVTLTQAVIRNLYFETRSIRAGRAIDTITYQTSDSPNSNPVESAVVASVSRLQRALAGH